MQHARSRVWSVVLLAVTALALGPVLVPLAVGGVRALAGGRVAAAHGIGFTVGVAVLIGLLATAIAWMPARVLARGGKFGLVVFVPVFMPPYLIFAGYGMMRDPSWWLGDRLTQLAAQGHAWVTIWFGYALAILGMALWSFPIAAVVLAGGFRARGREVDDLLRLDAGLVRRTVTRVSMHRAAVVAAVALVALLMIGSAVPLHLAQIPTMAIGLWRQLNETGAAQWNGVWVSGWPLMALAVVGAVWLARWLERGAEGADDGRAAPVSRLTGLLAWVVWAAAAVVPVGLFLASLRRFGSLGEFWRLSGEGVLVAAGYGAADALVCLAIAMVAAMVAGSGGRGARWTIRLTLGLWVFAAIIPGVFVGSALARLGTDLPRGWGDGLVVAAHVVRFGAIAVLAGVVIGRSEPPDRRDLRLLDDATGLVGWWRACVPWQLPALVGAALAVGLLGMHEIEATVLLLVPGRANLAQQILDYLHFSRTEELSAAAAILMSTGLLFAGIVSMLVNPRNRAS